MERFDYVIVGGGTAGCILANRLTESGRHSVLMLEAGGRKSSFWVNVPAGFSKLLVNPDFNWLFQTEPEEGVYNRRIVVPRGKGLGGSTLINGMIFVRGQPQDYDRWAQEGAAGWSFRDLLPYFKKMENFEGGGGELRGRGGPMNVVRVSERHEIPDAFIHAAESLGYPRNPDYNGADQEGFGYYQAVQRQGRRWTVVDGYLKPALARPNLTVRTDAHATRLDIADGRVTGVTYRVGGPAGEERSVAAGVEVILTAGAVQTPQLLELSGIGDPAVLQAAGIPVRHALPGVGRNYYDHYCTRMNWRVTLPITLNEISRGWRLGVEVAKYFGLRKGILTYGTGIAHGFVKTRPEMATPDVQYFFVHASYGNAATRVLDRAPGMTIGVAQLRPESRGTIHVTSPDPHACPSIRPNFLAERVDQEALVEGMRIARRIIESPVMDRYRAHEMTPGPDVRSYDEWLDFARRNGQTIYHPIGTCSMGTGPDAVVDPALRLRGLAGLRIADASVMPRMVSGNTQAAVMVVAEKAADLIRADAGAIPAAA